MPSIDLGKQMSQAKFAAMVGITQQRVSQLIAAGQLRKRAAGGEWLKSYCAFMREQAAGRSSDGDLDLAQERAALAREQRVSYEIKNAISRGEYAPISALADVLATASQAVVDRFSTLPSRLKKMRPNLTAEDHDEIQKLISGACREWARATSDMVEKRLKLDEEVEA